MEQAFTRGGGTGMLPPVDSREITWLEAFLRVVEWMEKEYPNLADEAKQFQEEEEEEDVEEDGKQEEFPQLKEVKNTGQVPVWPSVGSARRA